MSAWEAALRGTARGLAELLPVSSCGQLALAVATAALHSAGVC